MMSPGSGWLVTRIFWNMDTQTEINYGPLFGSTEETIFILCDVFLSLVSLSQIWKKQKFRVAKHQTWTCSHSHPVLFMFLVLTLLPLNSELCFSIIIINHIKYHLFPWLPWLSLTIECLIFSNWTFRFHFSQKRSRSRFPWKFGSDQTNGRRGDR